MYQKEWEDMKRGGKRWEMDGIRKMRRDGKEGKCKGREGREA